MGIKHIHSKQEWEALLAEGKPIVVDFHAVWCGPCKAIAPIYEKASEDTANANVTFAKIDVDEVSDVTRELGVTAMPTFILLKNGSKAGEVQGANPQAPSAHQGGQRLNAQDAQYAKHLPQR
ncbi:unnamed protein product [Parascedosporium putredinis]|uniref:Thioredoxin domain-containing protein n=1 Tax=Parascedosporium putredinis TaxID=1442378 RepID=A0A9P1GVW7_9PEZI|nr:unnamed protein product [Parascedosporium putredinis]CAI7987989.1 unnamed protein product [Parascedosporium putredinis]